MASQKKFLIFFHKKDRSQDAEEIATVDQNVDQNVDDVLWDGDSDHDEPATGEKHQEQHIGNPKKVC